MDIACRPAEGLQSALPHDQVLYLHFGLPKTGTTLLQTQFFPRHEQIEYLGKHRHQGFRNRAVTRFVAATLRQQAFRCDIPAARRLFERHIRPLMGREKAVVLSMEDGSHGSPRRRQAKLANLKAACGACRLPITLRNPLDFVRSMYLERVKKKNCEPRKFLARPWLPEFEEWLNACWSRGEQGELSHLFYADYIADWENCFGSHSAAVLLFEQLKHEPQKYFDQLAAFLGIRSIDVDQQLSNDPVNPSWTSDQLDRLRSIIHSRYSTLRFRLASEKRRRRIMGNPEGRRAVLSLSPDWHARICQITAAGNRRLSELRQLPLAQAGYPI